ncbi:MAG: putative phage tail protein [Sneathiella sp.]
MPATEGIVMTVRVNAEDYNNQLKALLPEGPAWEFDADSLADHLLTAFAEIFAQVHNRGNDLVEEMNPLSSFEMLPDWERVCGLPDDCYVSDQKLTLQERRSSVINKLNSRGGQSIGYFKNIALVFGYEIEITEYRPFVFGLSHVGDPLNGEASVRFYWAVSVTGPRVTWFRFGESQFGDPLAKISRAEDLECVLNRLKPAHTKLIFSYDGANQ